MIIGTGLMTWYWVVVTTYTFSIHPRMRYSVTAALKHKSG
jgi:hypothetical protein